MCGVATFTSDIHEQVSKHHPEIGLDVYVLDAPRSGLVYRNVSDIISADCAEDYQRVARRINESGADAVWLQHEYGIFGGPDGEMVCAFADQLAPPLIVTLHTVLSTPSDHHRKILLHLIARASRLMVMSRHARDLLVQRYGAPADIVEVIPHGAPDRPFGREEIFKARFGQAGRDVLMTFGLLSPGKGLERVIEALPAILEQCPNALYRIVGATHPNLLAAQGETYRESLKALARRLGVDGHVSWEDRFLDAPDLLDQLEACDIYITPYFNMQQSTSGTLSYAVALGKAVVATPYIHARELLANGVGTLIEPNSSAAIAAAVTALLKDRAMLKRQKRRAYEAGRSTIWPAFAAAAARLVRSTIHTKPESAPAIVAPNVNAVFAMSDSTGILQHSIGVVPDRGHGYCLDDNARALMLMNVAPGIDDAVRMKWSLRYASFVQHAWNPDQNRFRNFMGFDRAWREQSGSEDSNGRALWALGHTVEHGAAPEFKRWALNWFETTVSTFDDIHSPRALAFAILGAAAVLRTGEHEQAGKLMDRGAACLYALLKKSSNEEWAWFEPTLSYDNARLPQALIEAGVARSRRLWIDGGLNALQWLSERQSAPAGHFRPVGSDTFGHRYAALPFDQQPLEALATIEAAWAACRFAAEPRWIDLANTAFRWYFGDNDRGVGVGDLASGRCRDGVTPRGANENCGAESILAFQLAQVTIRQVNLHGWTKGEAPEPQSRVARQSFPSL